MNLTFDYRIREGRYRGLRFRARGSILHEDRNPREGYQLRFIFDYDLPVI